MKSHSQQQSRPQTAQEKVGESLNRRSKSSEGKATGDQTGDETCSDGNANAQDDLRCPICMDFFIDPALTDCAHVFCSFCIHFWFENRGRNICPQCRNTVEHVIPSPDLKDKVEKYVKCHFSKEQTEERERTRRTRDEDMRNATANLSSMREQFSVFGNDLAEDLFWSFTIEQPDDTTFSLWNNVNVPETYAPNFTGFGGRWPEGTVFHEDLQEFEHRLERAQRAYSSLVTAQAEMNHELEHLQRISARLETYNLLRDTVRAPCPSCVAEMNGNPDVLTNVRLDSSGDLTTNHPAICTDCMASWPWLHCSSYQYIPAQADPNAQEQYGQLYYSYPNARNNNCSHNRSRSRARTRTFRRHDHCYTCTNSQSPEVSHALGRTSFGWEVEGLGFGDHFIMQNDESYGQPDLMSVSDPFSRPASAAAGFSASISIETDLMPDLSVQVEQQQRRRLGGGRNDDDLTRGRHSPTPSFMGL